MSKESKAGALLGKIQEINESAGSGAFKGSVDDWKAAISKKYPNAEFEVDDFEVQAYKGEVLVGAYDTNDNTGVIS